MGYIGTTYGYRGIMQGYIGIIQAMQGLHKVIWGAVIESDIGIMQDYTRFEARIFDGRVRGLTCG